MSGILLTQTSTFIIGPVASLLGKIMEGIFWVLNKIGIENGIIGLSIILFTIIVNMLMMPLTVKQQKFSKLSAKMNPELQAIQAKYKNRKDNDSIMAMNAEQQEVYAKYGVSPSGSCLQMLIQFPIIFALYRVVASIPAYVGQIKDVFMPVVTKLIEVDKDASFIQTFEKAAAPYAKQFADAAFVAGDSANSFVQNTYIDVMNQFSTADWASIGDKFPSLAAEVNEAVITLSNYNNFLGLNMANSPSFTVKEAMSSGSWLLVIGALLIPFLAGATQWLSAKLMPQQSSQNGSDEQNTMVQSMKMMTTIMPIFSIILCYSFPAALGLYWIAGTVIRTIQQIIINKHIDKMDWEEEIKKNIEKRNKKLARAGIDPQKINSYANMSTRNLSSAAKVSSSSMTQAQKDEAIKKATEYYNSNAKPGSIAAKANMVKKYNENNK